MQLTEILRLEGVVPNLKAANKQQLLQELAGHAGRLTKLDPRAVLETLLRREKLGSTGFGHGIAIPHGKFAGIDRVHGVFARLAQPVEFDAVDDQPVDLVFALLAPETAGADHLKALARISRLFRDQTVVQKLRGTGDREGLYAILTEPAASAPHAA
jgi:PTS system nitrogen regulatory IIA component